MFHYWPDNYMWSYQVIRIMSQCQYGGGDINEVLDTCSRITLGDYDSFHKEWMNTGNRMIAVANEAMDQDHRETARSAFFRASNYIRTAEFFLQPDDERKIPTYKKSVEAFRKGAELLENAPKVLEIPFEGSFMPAYHYQVPGVKRGPLVIMFGGLDSTAEEMFYSTVPFLLERGISVLAVEGPGQGAALRLNHIVSRYDMNVAGTAALEYALSNLDVNPERIGILAFSMGGYHAARMAAFEPRFKACAILGAVYDYGEVWRNRPDNHPLSRIIQHVIGVETMPEAREKLNNFTLDGVAEKITCPTYVIHGENDRNVPISHAYRVYNAMKCPRVLKVVPASSTGSAHCQLDNITETFSLFDWLKQQLA
ncbi:alpha/beta hydrolase family protein [Paenibacillus periandrae]|uniref:alpha/beta hydrolase family protein n=1 Tax=Paenibacillus periandrae TaxID=1761741 RepID=UPI001F09D95E|nr:alpha/beta hydrolase [Paenibacillus periandrae]